MTDRDLHGRLSAVAETEEICFIDMQLLEQGRYVVGILLKAKGPVDIPGMAMRL